MPDEARAILKVAARAARARSQDEMQAELWRVRYLLDRAVAHLTKATECETHRIANTIAIESVREARKRLSHALQLEVQP